MGPEEFVHKIYSAYKAKRGGHLLRCGTIAITFLCWQWGNETVHKKATSFKSHAWKI